MRGDAYPIETRAYYMARHESGETLTVLSAESGIAREVLSRWWQRYQAGGLDALRPRSRRPHAQPTKTSVRLQRRVLRARRQGIGPARIAVTVPVSPATAHRILVDHGVNRLHPPQPKAARRFEKARPSELLHLDVKWDQESAYRIGSVKRGSTSERQKRCNRRASVDTALGPRLSATRPFGGAASSR
jgi:transposase-like protein